MKVLRRLVQPLRSRKVRVALATVISAYAAEYGLGVSQELLMTILGTGVAIILGIAHEDNGISRHASMTTHSFTSGKNGNG